jgi:4-hydroxybenzoate polyprenyltransferase
VSDVHGPPAQPQLSERAARATSSTFGQVSGVSGAPAHTGRMPTAPLGPRTDARPWLRAGRGLTLACHAGPTLAVTALAAALAVSAGRTASGVVLVTAAVLVTQLATGWCNDAVDWRRDAAVGRQDKPIPRGDVSARAVGTAAVVATVVAVPLAFASGVPAGIALTAALASALAYDLGLKATVWSWLPFAVSFGLLPASIVLGLPGHPMPPRWVVAAGALLGIGAHVANVLPDTADDLATGVRGLPQRLGPARARVLVALALVGAAAFLVLGPPGDVDQPAAIALSVVALLGVAVAAAPVRPGSRLLFLVVVIVALLDVTLLVARGTSVA